MRALLALLSAATAVSLSGCLVTTVVGAAVDVTEAAVKTAVEVPIAVGGAVVGVATGGDKDKKNEKDKPQEAAKPGAGDISAAPGPNQE